MDTTRVTRRRVNNDWYGPLGEDWYEAKEHPIALLRAQARTRNPWIATELRAAVGERVGRVLDLGCGAGLLANYLVSCGHDVVGLDSSPECLDVAARHDTTGRAVYMRGDARALPFDDGSFDAVCAVDLLEHLEQPERVISEAARVLVRGGMLFFHTFNRTLLAWLVAIKGIEWFVRNAPKDIHVLHLFLRPNELAAMCAQHGLVVRSMRGFNPRARSSAFWRMLATGIVGDDLEFGFGRSTLVGYAGVASKQ